MSAVAASPEQAPVPAPVPGRSRGDRRADAGIAAGIAAFIAAIAFVGQGGTELGSATVAQIAITLAGAAVLAVALLRGAFGTRLWGGVTLALLAGYAALAGISIIWSVQPSDTWLEANLLLSYVAGFAGAIALARLARERWAAILAGVALASVIVCGWALLTKVFPGAFDADATFARLREPFGYWNALAILGGLAVPGLLWLGARREGPAGLRIAATPALGAILVAIVLTQSRGALLAVAAGGGLWFALVPLRLRGLSVLVPAVIGAALPAGYALSSGPLSKDTQLLSDRIADGRIFGLLLVVMLGVLTAAAIGIARAAAARPPGPAARRRAGIAALAVTGAGVVAVVVALAASSGGLSSLVDPNASLPKTGAGRLAELGNVRARYWRDAMNVFADHPWIGVGAGGYPTARLRVRKDSIFVDHAHGFVPQVMADLGLVGLALSLALLASWLLAALRAAALRPRKDSGTPFTSERIGLITLLAVAVTFGVHSLIDWTWYVPAPALAALICAGYLAGRGPLEPAPEPAAWSAPAQPKAVRIAAAAGVIAIAAAAAWTMWQPQRSAAATSDALAAVAAGDLAAAQADAQRARDANPLAVEPLYALATVADAQGKPAAAAASYAAAVRLQPGNPDPWLEFGSYVFTARQQLRLGLSAMRGALYLDPSGRFRINTYVTALRAAAVKDPALARAFLQATRR